MKTTRICVLAEYFYPDNTGGSGTVLSKLLRDLRDTFSHVEVDVVASNSLFRGEAVALASREDWDGIHIRRLRAPKAKKNSIRRRLSANLLFTGNALAHLLRSPQRYDLILVVTAPPTLPLAARVYGFLTGTPYVYLVYDLYLDMAVNLGMVRPNSRAIRTLRKVQKSWLHKSSKTVVLGRCMRDYVAAQYDLPLHQMSVIPIPGQSETIRPQGRDTRFRRDNDLAGFVVLYAGNFARYQDFDTLLDAAKTLQNRRDITFVFVGSGTRREQIERRISGEEMTNVRLLPFVPEEDLGDMLASADVSLVTLERGVEGLAVPSKFYNILASGRPTVAVVSPASEVAHVIAESACGVRVDPEDVAGLARAIADLADAPDTVTAMGENARRVCEEKYTTSKVSRQFYDIFQEVLAPPAAPEQGSSRRFLFPRLRRQEAVD